MEELVSVSFLRGGGVGAQLNFVLEVGSRLPDSGRVTFNEYLVCADPTLLVNREHHLS